MAQLASPATSYGCSEGLSHPRLLSDDEHSEADDRQEGDETVGLTLRVLSALGFEDRGNLDYMLNMEESQWSWVERRFKAMPEASMVEALDVVLDAIHSNGPSCQALGISTPEPVYLEASFGYQPEQMHSIFRHLLQREMKGRPDADALSRDVNQKLEPLYRAMLVDWLVEVFLLWKLRYQTVHKAVVMFDRILSTSTTTTLRSDIQLIGVTCLLIACKKEEVCCAIECDTMHDCHRWNRSRRRNSVA